MSLRLYIASILLLISIPTVTCSTQKFDRAVCLDAVNAAYEEFHSRNPEYFALRSTASRPFLTLDGCNALCSDKWGPYLDIGPRLIDWIIPAILLIANLHFPSIGWMGYTMLAHFLGDPIDTMSRLLELVEVWVVNLRQAEEFNLGPPDDTGGIANMNRPKLLTIVISAAGRLLEPRHLSNLHTKIAEWLNADPEHFTARFAALRETAIDLRHLRLHDSRRTVFAIIVYLFQFVVVFEYRVGGSPNPSGGRVSPAMMLSWFLPVVVLSNVIGDYGSWVHSQDTILKFLEQVYMTELLPSRVPLPPPLPASKISG